MSNDRENAQINKLATQVAVIYEKINTIDKNLDEQRGDLKAMSATIQSFTFVKEADYQEDLRQTRGSIAALRTEVETLKSNTSVIVRFKNAVGEHGIQLMVLVLFSLIIFGIYLILKHSNAASLLSGTTGGER